MCCNEEPKAADTAFIGRGEASEPDDSHRADLKHFWTGLGSLAPTKPLESLASSLTLTIGLLAEASELDASWAYEAKPDASQACEAEHVCCNEEPTATDTVTNMAFIGGGETNEPDASQACEGTRSRLNSRMWGSLRWIS